MSESIIVKHHDLLKKNYTELTGNTNCFTTFSSLEYNSFQDYFLLSKNKDVKFKIESVETLPSKIPYFYWDSGFGVKDQKKKSFKYKGARTGLFKITCRKNDEIHIILFCCFLYGAKLETVNLLCGSETALCNLMNIEKLRTYKKSKPPIGIYQGDVDNFGRLTYFKKEERDNLKTIHHETRKHVEADFKYFFSTVKKSIQNGEKGTRKILLAGVQGTGKSGFIEILAMDNKEDYAVFFAKNLKELVLHLQLCSKYKVPTICILEDCENSLNDNSSELLNFFSGNLEPINPAGSYIIMTTNHPDKLSDRIKNRPERIDDIFILSYLNENDALLVTKQYFSTFLPKDFDYETLRGVFTGYTGAEVMKFSQDVKKIANFKHGGFDKIDSAFIIGVIKFQKSKYKKLAEVNTNKTELAKANNELFNNTVGFANSYNDPFIEDISYLD